jgi:tRNA threonylcarbamoyladenosine biosynthesis protein TsaB
MDARCKQVYNGLFTCKNGEITRLCEDRAMAIDDLMAEVKKLSKKKLPVYIVGDGAEIFYSHIKGIKNISIADEHRRFQNAVGVSVVAQKELQNENVTTPTKLLPKYLRLPQAERELKRKEEQK